VVGSYVDLTYDYQYLGSTMKAVDELLSGKSSFSEVCLFSASMLISYLDAIFNVF